MLLFPTRLSRLLVAAESVAGKRHQPGKIAQKGNLPPLGQGPDGVEVAAGGNQPAGRQLLQREQSHPPPPHTSSTRVFCQTQDKQNGLQLKNCNKDLVKKYNKKITTTIGIWNQ